MAQSTNPDWWDKQYDSSWDRIKAAFRRDWEQTKHDFGGKAPDLDQDVGDTLAQAAGRQPVPPARQRTYDDYEHAYRFGHGARQHYEKTYPKWDDKLESQLRDDWKRTYADPGYGWDDWKGHVRRGWDYNHPNV